MAGASAQYLNIGGSIPPHYLMNEEEHDEWVKIFGRWAEPFIRTQEEVEQLQSQALLLAKECGGPIDLVSYTCHQGTGKYCCVLAYDGYNTNYDCLLSK